MHAGDFRMDGVTGAGGLGDPAQEPLLGRCCRRPGRFVVRGFDIVDHPPLHAIVRSAAEDQVGVLINAIGALAPRDEAVRPSIGAGHALCSVADLDAPSCATRVFFPGFEQRNGAAARVDHQPLPRGELAGEYDHVAPRAVGNGHRDHDVGFCGDRVVLRGARPKDLLASISFFFWFPHLFLCGG